MEIESKEIESEIKSTSERRKEILEKIKKAGSDEYVTIWDQEGRIGEQKKKSKIKEGKTSRAAGGRFELRVRKDLEEKGWVVDKWSNNLEIDSTGQGVIIPAKRKFNPFSKVMTIGTGFPDFIAFRKIGEYYEVIGVEVKMNGILSKIEKQKCKFLLDKKIFNEIWVAKQGEREGRKMPIEYDEFKERYKRLFN